VSHTISSDCCTATVLEWPCCEPVDDLHGRAGFCPECGATGSFHVDEDEGAICVQWIAFPANVQRPEVVALWKEGENHA